MRITHVEGGVSPLGALGGPSPPVFIGLEFLTRNRGKAVHLAAGYSRGPTFPSTIPVISWDGNILLEDDAVVYMAARNDGGQTVEVFMTVSGEK